MSSYIDAISQASTAATGKEGNKTRDDAVMGKEDFLSLLVAQLQNQDPLNPDEPTEFTAQLAQFSSLEQLFTLNESMEKFVAANGNADRFATLNTIGKDVAYQGDRLEFSGDPVEFGYQLDGQASSVSLFLQYNGVTIKTLSPNELSPGNHFVSWDGLTQEGKQAPSGTYTIVLEAQDGSGEPVGGAPLILSEVTGVDLETEGGTTLVTKAGEVAFSTILGVYDKGSLVGSGSSQSQERGEEEQTEGQETLAAAVSEAAEVTEDTNKIIN